MSAKIGVFALFILLGYNVSQAQDNEAANWIIKFNIGPSFLNHDEVNAALEQQDFGTVSNTFPAFGIEFLQWRKRWMLGGTYYGYMLDTALVVGQEASLLYQYATIQTGFLFHKAEASFPWRIYSTLGLGAGFSSLRSRNFQQNNPIVHRTGGPVADLAVHVQRFRPIEEDKHLTFGLTIGFLFTPPQNWNNSSFAPDSVFRQSPAGPYLRLSIGMGRLSQ